MRYMNDTFKWSIFMDTVKYREYNPVPFCIPHVYYTYKRKSTKLIHNKFNKFNKLPDSAHKLFWRLHPNERFWLTR